MTETSETKAEISSRIPPWMRAIPFFLSALFFSSFFFLVFAPVPLMALYLRGGARRQVLGLITNSAIIFLLWGFPGLCAYLVYVGAVAMGLPYFVLHRKKRPDIAALYTLCGMALLSLTIFLGYCGVHGAAPLPEAKRLLHQGVDLLVTASSSSGGLPSDVPEDELKRNMMAESPSLFAISSLLMVWVGLLMLFRLHPIRMRIEGGIEPGFFKSWKAPEWLIWIAIACGGAALLSHGIPNIIAMNSLKFLMVVYGLQGVSILTFGLDVLKVRGIFRTLIYLMVTFFMTPLLIGLGFFDLWFDFRAKLRQS